MEPISVPRFLAVSLLGLRDSHEPLERFELPAICVESRCSSVELQGHLAEAAGVEPTTAGQRPRLSKPLHYRSATPPRLSGVGSNHLPPPYQGGALTR